MANKITFVVANRKEDLDSIFRELYGEFTQALFDKINKGEPRLTLYELMQEVAKERGSYLVFDNGAIKEIKTEEGKIDGCQRRY